MADLPSAFLLALAAAVLVVAGNSLLFRFQTRAKVREELRQFVRELHPSTVDTVADLDLFVRELEFFIPTDRPDSMTTHFVHADEAETSVGLFLIPGDDRHGRRRGCRSDPVHPSAALRQHRRPIHRPHTWSEGQGHNASEAFSTPEAVIGHPSYATAQKAKRPVAAFLKCLTLMIDEILESYPAGSVPVEGVTLRSREQLAPFLQEPQCPGWKSVHELPKIGTLGG